MPVTDVFTSFYFLSIGEPLMGKTMAVFLC